MADFGIAEFCDLLRTQYGKIPKSPNAAIGKMSPFFFHRKHQLSLLICKLGFNPT